MKENREQGLLEKVWELTKNPFLASVLGSLTFWLLNIIDFPPYSVLLGIVKIVLTLGMLLFSVCLIMAFINEIRRHRVLTPEEKFHSMLPEFRSLRDVLQANPEKLPFNNKVALTPDEFDAYSRINNIFTRFEIQRISEKVLDRGRGGIPLIILYLDMAIRYAEEKNLAIIRRIIENYKPNFDDD